MEDMASRLSTIRPPARRDPYVTATETGAYATGHNPFVYFHSIVDSPDCAKNDVPLTNLEDRPRVGQDH